MSVAARPTWLSGWGRYPRAECMLASTGRREEAVGVAAESPSMIARGMGRSYGDSSLNLDLTLAMPGMNRMLAFDEGVIECEAGVGLDDLIRTWLPRGWFVPVTPGTRFVTVGGMIASDVHGKNHHGRGSFCDHLLWVELALPGGRVVACSIEENGELFAATCGGMGLTGVILRAAFRMIRVETSRIRQLTIRAPDLDAALGLFEASMDWTYSVAWIDCLAAGNTLGRSVVFLGEHARAEDLPPAARADPLALPPARRVRVPVDFPAFALGPLSVRAFNMVYYAAQRPGHALVGLEPYFYPLDAIGDWNRIYGRRGFVQYQCVLPLEASREGLTRLLAEIAAANNGSFLAVLKRMGAQSHGLLSFPMPGYTLALDFPVKPATLALLDRLDAITGEHGGRVYLAKDARARATGVQAGYPRLAEFRAVRSRWKLDSAFSSLQSQRLGL